MTVTRSVDFAEQLVQGLDPEQRTVAQSLDGPVVVLAGAGTGKTRAITHRIAYAAATGRHDPSATLAVTFTNRAAGEMARRLAELGVRDVRVRTFHSAALRQLRWAWPIAVGGSMHELFESKFPLVTSVLTAQRLPTDPAVVRDVCTEIEWAKMVSVGPEQYPAAAERLGRKSVGGLDLGAVSEVYQGYEHAKRVANRIDFEDVLLLTVAVLEEREDLLRKVQASFRHFTVDEFQDVSAIQRRLLGLWLGERDDVCVVGDIAQTIYSFAGADPTHLATFERQFSDPRVINLTRCYRCSPEIVATAEHVLAGNSRSPSPSVVGHERLRLQSQCESGRAPSFDEYPDEHSEAIAVVRRIKELIKTGTAASDIAILVRINALTELFEAKLAESGVPYTVRGGRRFFERPEVRRAVTFLRATARARADTADEQVTEAGVRQLLSQVGYTEEPPNETGALRESWESLAALVALCDDLLAARVGATWNDVVAEIDLRESSADAPTVNGVTIASLHAAKGMEWQTVFIVGLVDGMVPMSHATTVEQVEEERRLLYVGMTRAKRELFVSWALTRNGVGRQRQPSRFVAGLRRGGRGAIQSGEHSKAPRRVSAAPATCRRCGKALVTQSERAVRRCRTCPTQVDQELLAGLRQWRKQRVIELSEGRDKQIPAYVVATDATLFAVAEDRPSSLADLSEIPGLGPAKLAAHGESILQIVAAHRQ